MNGCHVHQAFCLNKFGQFWMESRHTPLSSFHVVQFLQNPAQSEETDLIIEKGRGGNLKLNEIMSMKW